MKQLTPQRQFICPILDQPMVEIVKKNRVVDSWVELTTQPSESL